jgi:AcrR family transcriptional regulator
MILSDAIAPTLRRDAQDRRDRIVRAAVDVFNEEGFDAPLDRVADRAKVGRATLHRHFPTRDQLAITVLQTYLDDLSVKVAECGDRDDTFFVAIRLLADKAVKSHGLRKIAPLNHRAPGYTRRMREWLDEIFLEPLARAKTARLIREDFDPCDLHLLPLMVAVGGLETIDVDPDIGMERAMQLLMRGLLPSV